MQCHYKILSTYWVLTTAGHFATGSASITPFNLPHSMWVGKYHHPHLKRATAIPSFESSWGMTCPDSGSNEKPVGQVDQPWLPVSPAWTSLPTSSPDPATSDPAIGHAQSYNVLPKVWRRSLEDGKEKATIPYTPGFYDWSQATEFWMHSEWVAETAVAVLLCLGHRHLQEQEIDLMCPIPSTRKTAQSAYLNKIIKY